MTSTAQTSQSTFRLDLWSIFWELEPSTFLLEEKKNSFTSMYNGLCSARLICFSAYLLR